jgi:hypothetical protein
MAESMNYFMRRRSIGSVAAVMAILSVAALAAIVNGNVGASGYVSGWILAGLLVFLALYNVRKMVPFLPLGASTTWLQLHIYCGFVTFAVFAVHLRVSVPNGIFECLLASVYLLVFCSGVIGLFMTRSFPARLTMLGDETIFEQIPVVRRELQTAVEALVLASHTDSRGTAITEFYRDEIRPFLMRHYDVLSHLIRGESARWHRLLRTIDDQRRYLSADEQKVMDEVKDYVRQKHQLDTKYALQGALKLWLFVHIPATWALLIFVLFHLVLVHAWSGGLS